MLTVFFKDTGTHPYLRRGLGKPCYTHPAFPASPSFLTHPRPLLPQGSLRGYLLRQPVDCQRGELRIKCTFLKRLTLSKFLPDSLTTSREESLFYVTS